MEDMSDHSEEIVIGLWDPKTARSQSRPDGSGENHDNMRSHSNNSFSSVPVNPMMPSCPRLINSMFLDASLLNIGGLPMPVSTAYPGHMSSGNMSSTNMSFARMPPATTSSENMFSGSKSHGGKFMGNMSSSDLPFNSNPITQPQQQQIPFSTFHQSPCVSNFRNPLIDNNQSVNPYSQEQQLIKNIQEAKEKDASSSYRKSDIIPQASLDLISKDLQDAGGPFQSVEALKSFKNLSLGISSPEKCFVYSNLSAEAKEFKPRQQDTKTTKVTNKSPESCLQEAINTLTIYPYRLDSVCSKLVSELGSYDENTCIVLANILYEACVTTPNFCFNGCKLCSLLSQKNPSFRRAILNSAQKEFAVVFEKLHGSKEEVVRVHNFAQFLAELFLELKFQTNTNGPIRYKILSEKLVNVLEIILHEPNDANIKCVINALKVSIHYLEMDLDGDYLCRLNSLTMWLCSYEEHGLDLSPATIDRLKSFREMRVFASSAPEPTNHEDIHATYDPFNNEEIDSFILDDINEDYSDLYDEEYEEFLQGL